MQYGRLNERFLDKWSLEMTVSAETMLMNTPG